MLRVCVHMHACVRGVPRVCVCMHACVDWYGLKMVRTYVDATMAGARQNMRVRIPSNNLHGTCPWNCS